MECDPDQQRKLSGRDISSAKEVDGLDRDNFGYSQSLNSLAGLYYARGEYVRAEPLYQRALATLEKALGPDHPDVAISLNNLAMLRWARGDRAAAALLTVRADRVREKTIDENVKNKIVPPTEADAHAYFDRIKAYIATKSTQAPVAALIVSMF